MIMLPFESQCTATAVACGIIKRILYIVNTGILTRISYRGNKLSVDLTACYPVPVTVIQIHHDSVGAFSVGTNINHVLCSFREYIRVFHFILRSVSAVNLIAF